MTWFTMDETLAFPAEGLWFEDIGVKYIFFRIPSFTSDKDKTWSVRRAVQGHQIVRMSR
jgi:hypothetical protein